MSAPLWPDLRREVAVLLEGAAVVHETEGRADLAERHRGAAARLRDGAAATCPTG